jgi:hypothetical protein
MVPKVSNFIEQRSIARSKALFNSNHKKALEKAKHDLGVKHYTFKPRDLVFVYDSKSSKKKLYPVFRGHFRITGYNSDHRRSLTLRQLNGDLIQHSFYRDHLCLFKLQTRHLISQTKEALPLY